MKIVARVMIAVVVALLAFQPGAMSVWAEPTQDASPELRKLYRFIESRLKAAKSLDRSPRRDDNYFLIGLAQMTLPERHADVKFEVRQGLDATVQYIADYMINASSQNPREFQVFARFGNDEKAQEGLLAIRQQYDMLQAYREHLMRLYRAASVRRC